MRLLFGTFVPLKSTGRSGNARTLAVKRVRCHVPVGKHTGKTAVSGSPVGPDRLAVGLLVLSLAAIATMLAVGMAVWLVP